MIAIAVRGVGWIGVLVCVVFGIWALSVGISHGLGLLGVTDATPLRAADPLFVAHALGGAVALIGGSLQLRLAGRLARTRPHLHRLIGRIYLGSAWLTSVCGLGVAVVFDVNLAAKVGFAAESLLWLAATTIACVFIKRGKVIQHREWMIRSFALACFIITFGLVEAVWEATRIPPHIGYPLAVFGGWSLNLLVAEWWIRFTRARGPSDLARQQRRRVKRSWAVPTPAASAAILTSRPPVRRPRRGGATQR